MGSKPDSGNALLTKESQFTLKTGKKVQSKHGEVGYFVYICL